MQVDIASYLPTQETIVVGVSGGPDSMCLLWHIQAYFVQKKRKLTQVVVVTCDHGTRPEVQDEVACVRAYANGCTVEVVHYNGKDHTERALRQWRHTEFLRVAKKYGATKLFLGHNLTDRVETTLLHVCRGASLDGFLSLQYCVPHFMDATVLIMRPLLHLQKSTLQTFCDVHNIPYAIDPTNADVSFSQRNVVRHKILPLLDTLSHTTQDGESVFLRSMQCIYDAVTKETKVQKVPRVQIVEYPSHPVWEADWCYCFGKQTKEFSVEHFVDMLHQLYIYTNVSNKVLVEIVSFLTTKTSGYKYRNGVYFWIAHGMWYVIKARQNFWKNPCTGQYIDTGLVSEIFSCTYQKDIVYRYPLPTDTFHGKTLASRLSNQKVPMFWRAYVAVGVVGDTIVAVVTPCNGVQKK